MPYGYCALRGLSHYSKVAFSPHSKEAEGTASAARGRVASKVARCFTSVRCTQKLGCMSPPEHERHLTFTHVKMPRVIRLSKFREGAHAEVTVSLSPSSR